ncbi:PilT-like protein [Syntrophobacter sp. SbD1]|nr:PilT-like protein [Syntrophobacter sp. SbD1]
MKILLDTCSFLWIISDSPDLSVIARRQFSDPDNEVFLSAASAWEIIIKNSLGKLPLPDLPEEFIRSSRLSHFIETLPIDEESVLQLSRLPQYHKDPFDRIIICQAVAHSMTVLTPDVKIRQYPIRTLW